MCTSPITIKNKRTRFIPCVDREYITVPCGKCLECRNARRNEMYILSYFEHLQAVSNGGFTQFFTLTYSDLFVPKFDGRYCFSTDNVKKYLMNVNTACKREFGNDFKFRYLLVSEQESKGERVINPHHHVLFFVNTPCDHNKFRQICREKWSFVIPGTKKRIMLGWSFGSWDNNGEVNRPNGIRYVTKYVCKDMFVQDEDNKWIDIYDDKDIPERIYWHAKKCLGFVRHSKHFGSFAIEHIMNGDSKLPQEFQTPFDYIVKYGKIFVPCAKNGTPGTCCIPRSLLRTLFFTPTYRYKRITPRDIARCQRRGTPIPKNKVQSFYIPKPDYYDYYVAKVHRQIAKANDIARSTPGVNNISSASVALGVSVFSNVLTNSKINLDDYIDSCARIMMERDPIFERDPFDGSFSYKRAPLERTDFPELRKFVESDSDSTDFLNYMRANDEYSVMKLNKVSDDNFIEKTIKDITTVYGQS